MSNDIQMNDGGTKWTDIIKKGATNKIPLINRSNDPFMAHSLKKQQVIFEEDDFNKIMKCHRAEQIRQKALQKGTVIFEVPTKDFKDIIDIYLKIENQCGTLKEINHLSNNKVDKMSSLIIIAKFKNEDSIRKATSEGFTHNGLVHRGIVNLNSKDDIPKLVRVTLNQIPMDRDDQELITKLSTSLAYYGKIMQIRKITRLHFYEGEINILLDCNNKEEGYSPLQRSLYLEAWDEFFPASFIGAPPICFHCRQAGHIKRKCPALAHIKCGKCGNNGHTSFKCRSKNFREEIDEYIQHNQNQQDSTKDINNNRKNMNHNIIQESMENNISNVDEELIFDSDTELEKEMDELMENINREKRFISDLTHMETEHPTNSLDTQPMTNGELFNRNSLASKHATMNKAIRIVAEEGKEDQMTDNQPREENKEITMDSKKEINETHEYTIDSQKEMLDLTKSVAKNRIKNKQNIGRINKPNAINNTIRSINNVNSSIKKSETTIIIPRKALQKQKPTTNTK